MKGLERQSTQFHADSDMEDGGGDVTWNEQTKAILKTGNYYISQNSVFVPQKRLRLNIVPIVLNIMVPWVLFTLMLTLSVFRWRHEHEAVNTLVWNLIIGVTALYSLYRILKELYDVVPTWTRVATLSTACLVLFCYGGSWFLYQAYFAEFYDLQDMKVYPALDVAQTKGQDVMDGGKLYFTYGTTIDFSRSWHFKHHDTFCVAPLVQTDAKNLPVAPKHGSLDFFAVGKNCCSAVASDFRCGKFEDPHARSGIRVLDAGVTQMYRLAVQQAETEFDFISAHPIFFEWTDNPVGVMDNLYAHGITYYLVFVSMFFVWQSALVLFFVCVFGFLGRRPKTHDDDDDDEQGYGAVAHAARV